jgi:hypothetical protein
MMSNVRETVNRQIPSGAQDKNLHLPGRAELPLCPELFGGAAYLFSASRPRLRSAGFQTCCIAGFQAGLAHCCKRVWKPATRQTWKSAPRQTDTAQQRRRTEEVKVFVLHPKQKLAVDSLPAL